jgi:putative endonuclease
LNWGKNGLSHPQFNPPPIPKYLKNPPKIDAKSQLPTTYKPPQTKKLKTPVELGIGIWERRRRWLPKILLHAHAFANLFSNVNLIAELKKRLVKKATAPHLQRGQAGERVAKKYLQKRGLKFLAANFRSERGEVDLVFRDGDCLVFAEVKTRSSEDWSRPAAAVDADRRRRLSRCALDYLRLLKQPQAKIRFDIVEVLLADGREPEVRHLPNSFVMARPYRYG